MEVNFRKISLKDRQKVSEFIKSLYDEDSEGMPISDDKISKTFDELERYPEKGAVVVIEADSRIAGYGILINFWSNEYGGNVLCLDEFYITPDYRGQGVGTQFIRRLIEDRFGNSLAMQLEVTPSNGRALKLYERLGFELSSNSHMIYEF